MINVAQLRALLIPLLVGLLPHGSHALQFPIPDMAPSYQPLEFQAVKDLLPEADRAALLAGFPRVRDADVVALADLDLDGVEELILRVYDPDSCGTAGCPPVVFERVAEGWRYWPKALPDGELLGPGFLAVRDEVEDGVRTLYSNRLFAEVEQRRYSSMFPKADRGADERLHFGRQSELPEATQQLLCNGPCPSYAGQGELLAGVDLDGDGVPNWIFEAYRTSPGQFGPYEFDVILYTIEDGRLVEDFVNDAGIWTYADANDGLPALYLRDEFAGSEDAPRRTFYSSRSGPRLRVPF